MNSHDSGKLSNVGVFNAGLGGTGAKAGSPASGIISEVVIVLDDDG